MFQWLQFFFNLCLLKAAPQRAPASSSAQYASIFFYWVSMTAVLVFSRSVFEAGLLATIQTAIFVFLSSLVLWIRNSPDRIRQTLTAIMGSCAVIGFIALPLIAGASEVDFNSNRIFFVVAGALLLWETAVIGNILKHALDIPMLAGLGIALLFTYLSLTVTFRLLRVLAFSTG